VIVYLDTSALVKLYAEEEESGELVRQAVDEAERIATSTVAYAEARAGLARKEREGVFTKAGHRGAVEDLDNDWPTYARLIVSDTLSRRAGELAERHALRGYDSVHLASALRFAERFEDLRFLAFDDRLI
jgi:predicted nucleic acid-binding protein